MSTLNTLLGIVQRRNLEWARGTIIRAPKQWVLTDEPKIAEELRSSNGPLIRGGTMYCLESDRLIKLVDRKAVLCPNIDMWPDAYQDKGSRWVADSDCRKCKYYRHGRRSTCAWAREQRCGKQDPKLVAAQATLDALISA